MFGWVFGYGKRALMSDWCGVFFEGIYVYVMMMVRILGGISGLIVRFMGFA